MKKNRWAIILPLLCTLLVSASCAQNLQRCEVVFWVHAGLPNAIFFQISGNGEITPMIGDADVITCNIVEINYKSEPYSPSKEVKEKICEYLKEIKKIKFTDDRYSGIKDGPVVKVSYLGRKHITDYIVRDLDGSFYQGIEYQEGHQVINDFLNYLLDITHFMTEYEEYVYPDK